MNGTPRNPSSPDSSKTAAEIAAMRQVLTRKTEELREGYQAMEEKIAQPFPKEGSDEFKTFVIESLTAKTLSDILMVVEKYNRIPIKVFESGRIDEVDGKAMKGMIEKYLEDANFTQENTENYSFDINGIKLFKGKLSGLLSEEIEKHVIKNKGGILEEENVIQIKEEVHQENPLPANLPLQPTEALNGAAPDTQTINSLKESKITQPKLKKPGVLRSLFTRASNKLGKWQEKSEAEYANDNRLMRGVITQKEWAEEKRKLENGDSPMEQFEPESSAASNNKETTTKAERGAIKSILQRPPSSKINNDPMVKRSVFGTTSSRLKKIFGKKDKGNKPSKEGAVSVPTLSEEEISSKFPNHEKTYAQIKEDNNYNNIPEDENLFKPNKKPLTPKEKEDYIINLRLDEVREQTILENAKKKAIEEGRLSSVEQIEALSKNLKKVGTGTKKIRDGLFEKLGTEAKKIITILDKGSEYLNKNVDSKTKLFAAAGLLAAGALAAYATPVVVTAIGVTALGVRVVSAAGTYAIARKLLDKKWEEAERLGISVGSKKRLAFEAGAVGVALFSGQIIGSTFEYLASLNIYEHVASTVTDVLGTQTATAPVPEISTPTEIEPRPAPAINPTPDKAVSIFNIKPHAVVKGDTLWSILRQTLEVNNIDGFKDLSPGAQEGKIMTYLIEMEKNPQSYGVKSGKLNSIIAGKTIVDVSSLFNK